MLSVIEISITILKNPEKIRVNHNSIIAKQIMIMVTSQFSSINAHWLGNDGVLKPWLNGIFNSFNSTLLYCVQVLELVQKWQFKICPNISHVLTNDFSDNETSVKLYPFGLQCWRRYTTFWYWLKQKNDSFSRWIQIVWQLVTKGLLMGMDKQNHLVGLHLTSWLVPTLAAKTKITLLWITAITLGRMKANC